MFKGLLKYFIYILLCGFRRGKLRVKTHLLFHCDANTSSLAYKVEFYKISNYVYATKCIIQQCFPNVLYNIAI